MNEKHPKSTSGEYVFKRDQDGELQLVADFEGFYRDTTDPWGQSGTDARLKLYYQHSRATLVDMISRHPAHTNILEIGCGLGYVTRQLADALPGVAVSGMDISATAAQHARRKFPGLDFFQGDIAAAEPPSNDQHDVVILNQLLWYVLVRMENVFSNCYKMVSDGGLLVISTGFLNQQEYGRDIVDGFDGLLDYCLHKQSTNWKILDARYDDSGKFLHSDGIVILRKI